MIRNLKLGVSLFALVSFGLSSGLSSAVRAATFKRGQKFPAFTLKTVDGKTISPATLKNKAYWLTFFASG